MGVRAHKKLWENQKALGESNLRQINNLGHRRKKKKLNLFDSRIQKAKHSSRGTLLPMNKRSL